MQCIAVFLDDPAEAQARLVPLLSQTQAPDQWLMVACAPRMSHRVGKWVAHRAREHWRAKWLQRLRDDLEPLLQALRPHAQFHWSVARAPLDTVTAQLRAEHGDHLRLLDVRRSRLAPGAPAARPRDTPCHAWPWALGSGMSALLAALAD
jgi:hypothetical protein